jgi:hypothetical protein
VEEKLAAVVRAPSGANGWRAQLSPKVCHADHFPFAPRIH